MVVDTVTVQQLKQMRDEQQDFVLIDVREPDEYNICHLDGLLIPLGTLAEHLPTLDKSKFYILHCRSGGRSHRAAELMLAAEFKQVANLIGGISAWAREIDPDMPMY